MTDDPEALSLADLQRAGVQAVMERYGPHGKAKAAKALGVSRRTLYALLHRHGLTEYIQVRPARRTA